MTQHEGFVDTQNPEYVCKLNKALYGLKQAPRAWFERLRSALLSWDFHSPKSDVSLFLYHKGSTRIFLLVYVDDILVTGNDSGLVHSLLMILTDPFLSKS